MDTGYWSHREQTLQLVTHALRGERLAAIVNTHLQSDHCGGNAALQRAFHCPIRVPPGVVEAARHWDDEILTFSATDSGASDSSTR